MELLVNLMGISRIFEFYFRIFLGDLLNTQINPQTKMGRLLTENRTHLTDEGYFLFDHVKEISNGLVHSNFNQALEKTKEVYLDGRFISELHYEEFRITREIELFEVKSTGFQPPLLYDSSIKAFKDNTGKVIKTKELEQPYPIAEDFYYFYLVQGFVYVTDVLSCGLRSVIIDREKLRRKRKREKGKKRE